MFVEFLVKTSFIAQFRDLIVVNVKASLEREMSCKRFDPRDRALLRAALTPLLVWAVS